jgi:type IV pilus assembly protein PilA
MTKNVISGAEEWRKRATRRAYYKFPNTLNGLRCQAQGKLRHVKCNSFVEIRGDAPPSGDRGHTMQRTKGFSLIELLIVVAIILVIAAIAVPSFLHSRMLAHESSAAGTIRTLNTAQISYNSAYPTVGFATTLGALSGTSCVPPSSTGACLIDTTLASGLKNGYTFAISNTGSAPNSTYTFIASPVLSNYSGTHYFCSFNDAVVRVSTASISTCDTSIPPQN